ncbi:MAG: MFS transporter [Pseudomonadota bacterium]
MSANETKVRKISRLNLFYYGALAIPLSFAGLPLYLHAPDFYAAELGLSLTLIGTIVLIVRLFDAIQDPIIGYLSDKYSHLRRPIMLSSLGLLIASFLMVFHPPAVSTTLLMAWFLISLVLASTAFSILGINLNSLGSLWSEDRVEKTRITSTRESLGILGLIFAAILPQLLNLQSMAYILAVLCVVTGFLFILWTKNFPEIIDKTTAFNFSLHKLANSEAQKYFIVFAISMLASSIPGVLVIFFVRDLIGAENLTGLFLILYFFSGIVSMPLWQKIAAKKNKVVAWFVSMILAIVTFIWAFFLGEGDVVAYALVCIFSGLALGAELALPPAILSEIIDKEKDQAQTGLYFSAQAFILKGSFALGSGLAFLLLGQSDFVPKTSNSVEALQALSFAYALLPCLIKIISAFLLFNWMIRDHSSLTFFNEGNNNENKITHSNSRRSYHAKRV